MDNPILEAINLHFAAKKAEAIARLNIYVRNPVGVGEHPNIVEEAIKAVEDCEHADSCISMLETITAPNQSQSPVSPTPAGPQPSPQYPNKGEAVEVSS
tara:strand:- start:2092 stop:2388 length:297 start_codon:yes stop_codon:yes gene_type:complete